MDQSRRFECRMTQESCTEKICTVFLCVRRAAQASLASRVHHELENRRGENLPAKDTTKVNNHAAQGRAGVCDLAGELFPLFRTMAEQMVNG